MRNSKALSSWRGGMVVAAPGVAPSSPSDGEGAGSEDDERAGS